MSSNPSRIFLLCAAVALMAGSGDVLGADWSSIWKRKPTKSRTRQDLDSARTVAVGEFTGATGTTAARKLTESLSNQEELRLREAKAARFMLTGKSVGGRIDAKLTERDGKVIFERTYAAPGLEDNIKTLGDDVLFAVTGRSGLSSSQLAFVSDVSGMKQVYVCDADGSNVEQVTRHPGGAVAPAISPDFLAYTGYSTGFPCVMLVDMGAGAERRIAGTPGLNSGVAFAPDGRRVALTMSFVGNPEIFVLDLPTSNAVCVTESVGTPSNPAWHPDGNRLIFSSNEGEGPQLFVVEADTEKAAQKWACGYAFAADPEWSPDGKQVAFTARLGLDFGVVIKPYPTGSAKVIQKGGAQHPTWSPDGHSIAYVQNGQLWIQDITSSKRRSVVSGRGEISEPRWMR
jgi:TolB protein